MRQPKTQIKSLFFSNADGPFKVMLKVYGSAGLHILGYIGFVTLTVIAGGVSSGGSGAAIAGANNQANQ